MKESAKPASAEGAKRRIPHRWSGWPGAVCMDCGREDLREVVCCVEHDVMTCLGTPECTNPPCLP